MRVCSCVLSKLLEVLKKEQPEFYARERGGFGLAATDRAVGERMLRIRQRG